MGWPYSIAVYNPDGVMLTNAQHTRRSSRDIELEALKERFKRGEVGHLLLTGPDVIVVVRDIAKIDEIVKGRNRR